jgi:DNA-binding MarR family transcriptional regulator
MTNRLVRRTARKSSPPGTLIRRLHQIYVAIYARQCAEFGTTPVQSSIMQVLLRLPGIDQVALAGEIGIDRTTVSSVLTRLEERGILRRVVDPDNRRIKRAFLTQDGKALLLTMQHYIDAAHDELISPLNQAERKRILVHLADLVQRNNELGRTVFRIR